MSVGSRFTVVASAVVTLALVVAPREHVRAQDAGAAGSGEAGTRVYKVDSVDLTLEKSNPPNLVVAATGRVRTSGWTNARLVMRGSGPKDGVYEFDFVARPPTGNALQVILPVVATHVIEKVGNDVKGVRVFSETNDVLRRLEDESADASTAGARAPADAGSQDRTDPSRRKPCVARYRAQQLADKTILVIAEGSHRTGGYKASLEPKAGAKLEFEMWHEPPQGQAIQMITYFTTAGWARAEENVKSVTVTDERGPQNVSVTAARDFQTH
jgi:hypothetical protein